jgi:hypothetical protein
LHDAPLSVAAACSIFPKKESAMQVNAYLHFKGNCEAAFKYYEQILAGKSSQ